KRCSIKVGIVGFPGLIAEAQPRPCTGVVSGSLLFGPHVVQRRVRIVAEFADLSVVGGQDQSVEDGLGAARFDGLVRAAVRVTVERSDLVPKADTLGDIVEEPAFVGGGSFFGKRVTESGPGEYVGHRAVTRDTKCIVIARGFGPFHPPACSLIELSGGSGLIP